jgi:predicted ArsR family transcriptional regulator
MAEELGSLDSRRREAEILKPVYDTLKGELGEARAKDLLGRAVESAALDAGRQMAAREKGKPGTRTFAAIQPLWQKGGALKSRTTHLDDDSFDYEVTHCAYRDMYESMGLLDLGTILSCRRDEFFVKGYAPDLKLSRDSTIMEGAARCLFHYYKEKKA